MRLPIAVAALFVGCRHEVLPVVVEPKQGDEYLNGDEIVAHGVFDPEKYICPDAAIPCDIVSSSLDGQDLPVEVQAVGAFRVALGAPLEGPHDLILYFSAGPSVTMRIIRFSVAPGPVGASDTDPDSQEPNADSDTDSDSSTP